MSWKDDKNLGPWAFTKQPNKPSYNEGDHIATYANPVWSMEEGSNVPITPTHTPCGYWTKDYVPPPPPFVPPLPGYLIGWYKFDEGSGLIVNNYATDGSSGGGLLPNLAVVQNDGAFWTFYPGFGSTQDIVFGAGDGLVDFAWANPNRIIGGANKSCFGMFVRAKPSGYPSGSGGCLVRVQDAFGSGGGSNLFISNENEGKWQSVCYDGKVYQWEGGAAENQGRWHFHFVNNLGYWYVVRPEGNRILLIGNVIMTNNIAFQWMFAGCWYANASPPTLGGYPGGGSYADWIIYNQTTLTDSQWAEWYDKLRSRYGMAARSGW